MSNNSEQKLNNQFVHLYLAMRRKKDNPDMTAQKENCHRQIINVDNALDILKAKCSDVPGIYRIYRTVNKRNCETAKRILLTKLINNPDIYNIEAEWRTALLQPEAAVKGYWLIDLDDKNKYEELCKFLQETTIPIGSNETPNGYHFITMPFDTRLIPTELKDSITILKDGYIFVEKFEVK